MRNDAQLRQVFNATFDALQPVVRSKIEDLWRQNGVPCEDTGSGRFIPPIFKEAIILNRSVRPIEVPGWSGPASPSAQIINAAQELVQRSQGIWGQTDSIIFRFKTSVVDQAPDEMLKIVIAHELAHTYRAAEVGQTYPQAAITLGTSESEEEEIVRALTTEWDFDEGRFYQWLHANEAKLRV